MNIPILGDSLQHMWDIRLVLDMFLAGTGAGAFIIAILASHSLGWERMKWYRQVAAVTAPVAMAVSLLLLLTELTQPGRSFLPFFSGQVDSPMMWGSWLQFGFLGITAIYALIVLGTLGVGEKVARGVGYLGAVTGISVIVYHGVFLTDSMARPLWAFGGLPILFPIFALATGAAFLVLAAGLTGGRHGRETDALVRIMTWTALGAVVGAIMYLWTMGTTSEEARAGAQLLMSGELSLATWGGVLIAGIVGVVISVLALRGRGDYTDDNAGEISMGLPTAAAVLILVAGFSFRYIVVIGGQALSTIPVS